jgi:hypothetical protein
MRPSTRTKRKSVNSKRRTPNSTTTFTSSVSALRKSIRQSMRQSEKARRVSMSSISYARSKGHGGAVKYDEEKVRFELLSTLAIQELAKVLTFGAKKYTSHNWRRGFTYSRLLGASLRHIFAFMRCEDCDIETGLSHLAHAMCCLMFLLEHHLAAFGCDDRWDEYGNVSRLQGSNESDSRRKRKKKRSKKCVSTRRRAVPSKSRMAR